MVDESRHLALGHLVDQVADLIQLVFCRGPLVVEWAEEDSALGELFIQSKCKRFSLGLLTEKDETQ